MTTNIQSAPWSREPPLKSARLGVRRSIVALAVTLSLLGLLGTALAPWLLVNAPLLFVALTPALQNVALTAPFVQHDVLLPFATLRRSLSVLSTFWLGAVYGELIVAWVEQRSPRTSALLRMLRDLLYRTGPLLLVLFPVHSVAALAGAAGYRTWTFVFSAGVGQLAQVWLSIRFGAALADWTRLLVAFIGEHLWLATGVCIALAAAQLVVTRVRTGRWVMFGRNESDDGGSHDHESDDDESREGRQSSDDPNRRSSA